MSYYVEKSFHHLHPPQVLMATSFEKMKGVQNGLFIVNLPYISLAKFV